MPDVVDAATRSRMMAGIRGKNTKPELLVRHALHRAGYRYRLHDENVPGKPDIVLSRYRAAIFVNGCFWHGHDCSLFKLPGTNVDFWRDKIARNRARDLVVQAQLVEAGWRSLIIWECALKGKDRLSAETTLELMESWIKGDSLSKEIRSKQIAGQLDQ